jgi:hypothetical protein
MVMPLVGWSVRLDSSTFPSAHDAISWAIRRRSTPIIDKPSIYSMSKKRAVFEWMPGLDAWEKLAEAVYIFKALEKNCSGREMIVLETYYAGGTNEYALGLAGYVGRMLKRDKWFCYDVLRGWARERPHHNLKWWSKRYRVSESTIRRWQSEIVEKLDLMLQAALIGAGEALRQSGHVEW